MQTATVYVHERFKHQKHWMGAVASGLERHGVKTEIVSRETGFRGADIVALWGVSRKDVIEAANAAGATVIIAEAGYVGRYINASLSIGGGLNGFGRFPAPQDDGERGKQILQAMKPWKENGGYALICGQVPTDQSVRGVDLAGIYNDAADRCDDIGLEPVFRPHPVQGMAGPHGVRVDKSENIEAALEGAALAITYNSNSGVDAAMAGVPVVALNRGSMAWEISAHKVEQPIRPDRTEWANALAWKQWNFEEIATGKAWGAMKKGIEPAVSLITETA